MGQGLVLQEQRTQLLETGFCSFFQGEEVLLNFLKRNAIPSKGLLASQDNCAAILTPLLVFRLLQQSPWARKRKHSEVVTEFQDVLTWLGIFTPEEAQGFGCPSLWNCSPISLRLVWRNFPFF